MSEPVDRKKRATYRDVLDAPPSKLAEIIDGDLHLSPRPGAPHTAVAAALYDEIGPPFKRGRGGPGGWIILPEPELHLGEDILVPDLAGWRRERMPMVPDAAYFTVVPDWICEVLSFSTEKWDRADKLPRYAAAGVSFAWLVNPTRHTLEAYRLTDGLWVAVGLHEDGDRARIEPFEAIELDLAMFWID